MKPVRHLTAAAKPLAAFALVLGFGSASALPTINLTNIANVNGALSTTSGVIDGVTFKRDTTQPAGTGVFNPFLRLDCKGNGCDEQGYNTSAVKSLDPSSGTTRKILDNMTPVNWTHDVLFSDLQLTADGLSYQFKLDINEPGNGNSLLSLDGLKLMSTAFNSQYAQALDSKGDLAIAPPNSTEFRGTVMWDMDANGDKSVLLDATVSGGPGSGIADMVMLVSKDIIDTRRGAGENYFVLWSRFGIEYKANTDYVDGATAEAGFEEWSYSAKPGTPCNNNCGGGGGGGGNVPVPGTAALAVLGLGLLGSGRKRAAKLAGTAA